MLFLGEALEKVFNIIFTDDIGNIEKGRVTDDAFKIIIDIKLTELATDEPTPVYGSGSGSGSWSDGGSASECSSRGGTEGE